MTIFLYLIVGWLLLLSHKYFCERELTVGDLFLDAAVCPIWPIVFLGLVIIEFVDGGKAYDFFTKRIL